MASVSSRCVRRAEPSVRRSAGFGLLSAASQAATAVMGCGESGTLKLSNKAAIGAAVLLLGTAVVVLRPGSGQKDEPGQKPNPVLATVSTASRHDVNYQL